MKKFKKRLTVCLTGFAGGDFITAKKRKRRYSGGAIVAVIVTVVLAAAMLTGVIMLFVNSNKRLGEAMHPNDYDEYVYKYAAEYSLEPNLVFAIIKTESNFNPDAGSTAGAMGLMQLMPETFEWLQNYKYGEVTMTSESLYDPEINIQYGCIFLHFLMERYSVEETAVAAYNAGFGAVDSWLENSEYSSDGKTLARIPYPETEAYVEKVEWAKNYYNSNGNNNEESTQATDSATESGD